MLSCNGCVVLYYIVLCRLVMCFVVFYFKVVFVQYSGVLCWACVAPHGQSCAWRFPRPRKHRQWSSYPLLSLDTVLQLLRKSQASDRPLSPWQCPQSGGF